MRKYDFVVVGYKFTSKCGEELEVIEIVSSSNILVSDCIGRTKRLTSAAIANKSFKWKYSNGLFCERKPRSNKQTIVDIGKVFKSNFYGDFEVIEKVGGKFTVRFLETGAIKDKVSVDNVLVGAVKDPSLPAYSKYSTMFKAGTILRGNKNGNIIVVDFISHNKIVCKWENSGNIKIYCGTALVNYNRMKDSAQSYDKRYDGNYIYYVYHEGDVVYVGRGKGRRYLHANSGRSSCRELNKLHFQGVVFNVEVVESGLSYNESKEAEKIHMKRFETLWNEKIYQ
jgi:hypothetical protein